MAKKIWIVEGLGDGNPTRYNVNNTETIRSLKTQFSNKLGVRSEEIEVSTETNKLTNENAKLIDVVDEGDTIHIIPRAKAGM